MGTHTWVAHPDTGGVWACPNEALHHYAVRGWVLADAPEQDDSHLYDTPETPADAPEDAPEAPAEKPEPTNKVADRGQTSER